MRRYILALMLGSLIFGTFVTSLEAQVRRPGSRRYSPVPAFERPALSPYLDLLGNANSFEFNYFQRVQPRLEFQRAQSQFRRSLQGLQRQVNQPTEQQSDYSSLGPTGHSATFLNYGGYFNLGSGGGTGAALGGGRGVQRSATSRRSSTASRGANRRANLSPGSSGRSYGAGRSYGNSGGLGAIR